MSLRVNNHPEHGTETCNRCERGLAITGRRPAPSGVLVDEYGPCPHCELGCRFEFPEKCRPRWPNGYWQGRPAEVIPPPRDGYELPKVENAMRARLLMRRFAGADVDPLLGIDLRDPAKRLAMLRKVSE